MIFPVEKKLCIMVQGRARQLTLFLTALATTVGLSGCADNRSLKPSPEKYKLFVSVAVPGGIAIDVIDTEVDSVVQRIPNAGSSGAFNIQASTDGANLAALDALDEIILFDITSLTEISSVSTQALGMCLSSRRRGLIGWMTDSTLVYNLPDLDLDTVLRFGLELCIESPNQNQIIGIRRTPDLVLDQVSDVLVRICAMTLERTDSFRFVSPATSGGLIVLNAALSPNGEKIFLLGYDEQGNGLFSYNLETHVCNYRVPLETGGGDLQLTPDGRELWLTQSFPPRLVPPPLDLGYLLVVDAVTGIPVDTIRTVGLRVGQPTWPLPMGGILIHPAGNKAYVVANASRPALIVIDTSTRSVLRTLYVDDYTNTFDLAIAPG